MKEYDWNWRKPYIRKQKILEKLRRKENELWNIWWSICTTRIKRKIR